MPGEALATSQKGPSAPDGSKAGAQKRPRPASRSVTKRKLGGRLSAAKARSEDVHAAVVGAATLLRTEQPGILVPENSLEKTFKLRQPTLLHDVDAATKAKASFHLDLSGSNLQPYCLAKYSRSGKTVLVASRKGHVALATWRSATLHAELHLNETIRDGVMLHNDNYFALAQKKYVYIYDASGTQLHVLRKHRHPGCIAFLPHHFLLASATAPIADEARLAYTDTSTGQLVADLAFGARALNLGHVGNAAVNCASGVLNLAHSNGVVSQWSPVQSTPLARVFTHPGGVSQVSCTLDGLYMVTAGADATIRTWDMRTYKQVDAWRLPANASSLAVSQRGLIAAGFGATVHVWSGVSATGNSKRTSRAARPGTHTEVQFNGALPRSPYMVQQYPKRPVTGLDFCPFEDILAVSHVDGMASMVVPGAGEPTFDTSAPNPYATAKQRREAEIGSLLDKLRPETIALDVNYIGGVDPDPSARLVEMRSRIEQERSKQAQNSLKKRRAKGRGKISKQLRRKQTNVIDAKRVELHQKLENEREERKERQRRAVGGTESTGEVDVMLPALKRFVKKHQSK
jgi:U3 small nucleolar RNA-associated protein 7